jgi:formylglycine-generating enzyme required for sulfatase activity
LEIFLFDVYLKVWITVIVSFPFRKNVFNGRAMTITGLDFCRGETINEQEPENVMSIIRRISAMKKRAYFFYFVAIVLIASSAPGDSIDVDLGGMNRASIPNYNPALTVELGPVPVDGNPDVTDGDGLQVFIRSGEAVFLALNDTIPVDSEFVKLSVYVRSNSADVELGLVALAYPIDGSLGYANPTRSEIPVNRWGKIEYVYQSPTSEIIPALQVAVPAYAPSGVKIVYIDTLQVEPYTMPDAAPINMIGDNTFNSVNWMLIGLNPNSFLPGGNIPGIVSLTTGKNQQGVKLQLSPNQLAAHVALYSDRADLPAIVFGGVDVKREYGDSGMLAYVVTDGEQSLGYFLHVEYIPTYEFKRILFGGNFEVPNKQISPIGVVQLGGPDVSASVVIDNLELFTGIVPTPTPIPPTPTATPTSTPTSTPIPIPLSSITVDIPNLPEDAKPLEMVLIPAGTFTMGSPYNEQDRIADEGPQHQVTITRPFYMGKYEVTQAQWQAVMGRNTASTYGVGNNYPVYYVSWDTCVRFCNELSERQGLRKVYNESTQADMSANGYRLPTEAEWEYACRAGTTTRFYWGDDPNYSQIGQYAWYGGNSPSGTNEVGLKLPNAWGLYDMSGNVWEWCGDWFGSYANDAQIDPIGLINGSLRVIRSGRWFGEGSYCRSALRNGFSPGQGGNHIGLRLQRSYP